MMKLILRKLKNLEIDNKKYYQCCYDLGEQLRLGYAKLITINDKKVYELSPQEVRHIHTEAIRIYGGE